jgi:zinc and cadmium transporter
MTPSEAGLLCSGLAAGADLLGGSLVAAKRRWDARFLDGTLSLGTGFMLAAALLDIIPAGLHASGQWLPMLVLAGYLLVLVTQWLATPRNIPGGKREDHHGHHHAPSDPAVRLPREAAVSALIGLLVHTFFDGVAIGAAFQVTASLGLLVFLAVLLHKLPEGLALGSIVLSAGGGRRQAMGAVALIGLATVIGTGLTGELSVHYRHSALSVSGGVTLYVTASDLVPQVMRSPGSRNLGLMLAGVVIYAITSHMLHLAGLP